MKSKVGKRFIGGKDMIHGTIQGITKVFLILSLLALPTTGSAVTMLEAGPFKIKPQIRVSTRHTDNLFRTEKDRKGKLITVVAPEVDLDFAISEQSRVSLLYQGDYRLYRKHDDLNTIGHMVDLAMSMTQPKGSTLRLSAGLEDSTIRPYGQNDLDKDFLTTKAAVESELKLGSVTGLELGYDFLRRRFERNKYVQDEFDRQTAQFGVVYDRWPLTSLLFQYSYAIQDNNDLGGPSTDMKTHTLFGGFRRKPSARLSGNFKAGYTQTQVKDFDGFQGLALEGNILYELTSLSRLSFTLFRNLTRSTTAERETNIYFISTGGTADLTYQRWHSLQFGTSLSYKTNDYQGAEEADGNRADDLYSGALRTKYTVTPSCSLVAEYIYRNNDSNQPSYSYEENVIGLRLLFEI